jgi:hypothetical protein
VGGEQLLPAAHRAAECRLVVPNRFWQDYALWDARPFLSTHLAEASGSFTEMLSRGAGFAVPVEGGPGKVERKDNVIT